MSLDQWAASPGMGRARRRLRIAIDMDEVIADSLGKHLRSYNETFGDRLTRADLGDRSLEEAVPPGRREATEDLVLAPGFFRDLEPIEGSREVVRQLAERYEVFIATAAMEVPTSFADKYAWLRQHFPFIPTSHIVFCGDKGVLDVDYLIDDTSRHFARFRGMPILFSAPHNRGVRGYRRVESWAEVGRVFLATGEGTPAQVAIRELPEGILEAR
jgi:5'-nucleotidase